MTSEKIILVSCVKTKQRIASPAKDLYVSPLFRAMRAYAQQHGDRWFVLSAKYGLVDPDQEIEPYDQTLKGMPVKERREWAIHVRSQMQDRGLLNGGVSFVWLAGRVYRQHLSVMLSDFPQEDPLIGKGIGERIAWLRSHTTPGPVDQDLRA